MRCKLSRRTLLATASTGAALAALPIRGFAQAATELDFVVWNYSLETIQDNIKKFEAANPGIKVGLTDYTWPDYFDTMMLRFRGNTPTDVMYCGEDWLPGWALAGWLVPIEDYFPEIANYKDKVANYAVRDMTYNGKLYGLPYYADLITFQYNQKILEEHGIAVPQDWDEVLDACLKLKQAGMEKPIVYEYNQTLPNFYQAFVSQVYGRGGQMFDEQLNPLFNDPQSEAFKHLQWLQDAVTEHDIIAFENHESRVIPAMNTGKHAFTVLFNYVLAAMNERADAAARRPVRHGVDAGPGARLPRLLQVLRDDQPGRRGSGAPRGRAGSSSSSWAAATIRSPSAGRSRKGSASPNCRCSTTPTCSRPGRAGSTSTRSSSRPSLPSTARRPNGSACGAASSGRSWPRHSSARRASPR